MTAGEDADWGDDDAADDVPPVEWTAPPERDEDELAAIRTLRLVVVAAVLAAIGFVAIGLSRVGDDSSEGDSASDLPTLGADSIVSVGPTAGAAVADYVAAQSTALAGASGTRVAVVSFAAYEPAASVDTQLADVELLARLVALPGGAPVAVDEPLENWLEGQRAPLQSERDEIAGILPTIEDPDDPFIAGYQEDLARLDAQLSSLDPAAALVFGVVVRGDADALRSLASQPGVRVVAVAEGDETADLRTYRGLRPEETAAAGTPDVRPA